MHILHVNSGVDPRQGGPTTAMLAMIHAQIDAGLKITVASTFGHDFESAAAEQMKRIGADVHLIGPSTNLLAWHRDIKPTLRRLIAECDVVHIHGVWEEIQHQAARIAHAQGKPYIFTPHGMLDPWSLSQSRLKKQIYLALRLNRDLDQAAAIHFTDETERDLVATLSIKAPAIVERLIIDLSDFQPLPPRGLFRAKFAQQLGDRRFVLFMSRIHHKKGLDLLVPAFAKSASQHDAMLVIAGPDIDEYQSRVQELARDSGIADRVLFPGMIYGKDRAAAMVDAELFALTSYQENFGVVVIEALAAGTPVIISDQVAIHRQITRANVGAVVPTNIDHVTETLTRWLTDRNLHDSTSSRAREFVRDNFDRTAQSRRWIDHYRDLIS
ncbi:MAG: glycosyltransferase [Anaerolineae bacterium]|nr:glycosyltransferase [Phycisphaerae bacterium]